MSTDLRQKLKDRWDTFTASEQKIASYLLHHFREVPFETAASLSKRVGVSPMTVGRFLRNLGYEGVGDLKEELRGNGTWRDLYKDPQQTQQPDALSAHLQTEILALEGVHALVGTKEWKSVVKLLASAQGVSIAGFQHGEFMALGLASLLQQVRPGVRFHSGADGAYIDLLLESTRDSCVVLIDDRRYFKPFRALAEEVMGRSIPLVLLTDTDCYWARELTPHVLMYPAERAWHSYTAYSSLVSLLVGGVIQECGDVMERLSHITQLREKFVGYIESPPRTGKEPGAARPKRRGKANPRG
jgi:DNA-binding MurR/RpiR family transcriptional regulator